MIELQPFRSVRVFRLNRSYCAVHYWGVILFAGLAWGQEPQGFEYSKLKLVDEISCATDQGRHQVRYYPDEKACEAKEILGRSCLVLKMGGSARFMAFNIGAAKGLKAGGAYVLTVDFPEDQPRLMFIQNWGCETGRGVATGKVASDTVIGKYVNNNPESLSYPLSSTIRRWNQLFYLHQRTPEFGVLRHGDTLRTQTPDKGFWVYIAQPDADNAPLSAGAAVATISLYEVEHPETYDVAIRYPPAPLPRRFIFYREEMADGVVSVPHGRDKPLARGMDDPNDWFEMKMKNMKFLGMNTFSKDLLEFGHNQGWNAHDDQWFVPASTPDRWSRMLETVARNYKDLYVLPYFEYGGSTGPSGLRGNQSVRTLKGEKTYTQIAWLEKNAHINILDPEALADAKRLLDCTVIPYTNRVNFVGAWFRTRPSQRPMSFGDRDLARYASESGVTITREVLSIDKMALNAYYKWWFAKRHAFLAALAKHLRDHGVGDEAIVMLTTDASEPGDSLPGNVIVTDDVPLWDQVMAGKPQKLNPLSFDQAVKDDLYGKVLLNPLRSTWGKWEWQHSVPGSDPANFRAKDGTVITYTFNRLYTVANPATLEAFRSGEGLAMVRHHTLNENMMSGKDGKDIMGYFASDMERAGPYCMMEEAWAMANGDPRYLGYLIGNSLARGFPEYVRAFNAAFLALPALPSHILKTASTDPEVVVRAIPAGAQGTYFAVVNTGFGAKTNLALAIPDGAVLVDAVTGEPVKRVDERVVLSFYPGQLKSFCLK